MPFDAMKIPRAATKTQCSQINKTAGSLLYSISNLNLKKKSGTRLGWAANQDGTGVRGSQQRSPEEAKVGAGA